MQQLPQSLICSMRALLKTLMKWNDIYTMEETWWGIGEKAQSKQNINPVWFPSHPHFYDVESWLFFGIQSGPKTSRTIPIREGPKD